MGNTPAYAGKTPSPEARGDEGRKHPRLRGEDFRDENLIDSVPETPPLTRGRLNVTTEHLMQLRNTPAYAGKTASNLDTRKEAKKHPRLRGEDGGRRVLPPLMGKHPRLRGEDPRVSVFCGSSSETPPLTRGRRRWRIGFAPATRNTPAYAGKTWRHAERRAPDLETPPLTRGRLTQGVMCQKGPGNTPAYAGKT